MAQRKASPRAARADRRERRAQRKPSHAVTPPAAVEAPPAPPEEVEVAPSDRRADAPTSEPAPGWTMPGEPTTHAVLREEKPAPAPVLPPPPMLELAAAPPGRGNTLVSQIGFFFAALGLALVAYSFYYASTNYPANFNPGGMSGIRIGAGLFLLGAIVGILFVFVPASRPVPAPLDERTRAYQLRVSKTMAGVGIGLTVLGLLVAANAYRAAMAAGLAPPDSAMGAMTAADVGALGAVLAVAGIVLWTGFGLRARAFAAPMPAAAEVPNATAMFAAAPVDPTPTVASRTPLAFVSREELLALMRRIDALLASLPDEVVRDFSRSPEADTYLKLMRESEPEKA